MLHNNYYSPMQLNIIMIIVKLIMYILFLTRAETTQVFLKVFQYFLELMIEYSRILATPFDMFCTDHDFKQFYSFFKYM